MLSKLLLKNLALLKQGMIMERIGFIDYRAWDVC